MTNKSEVEELRKQIVELLNQGLTPTKIANTLDCSRTTVHKVRELLQSAGSNLNDGRRKNKGRPVMYEEAIWQILLQLRMDNMSMGPSMLYHTLCRRADEYGINPEDIPAPSSIARYIQEQGLAVKPVGPRDLRTYPDNRPTTPGTYTIDTWGPWHCRAQRLFLITIQDRFTKAATAYPVSSLTTGVATKLTAMSWAKAIQLAYLLQPPNTPFERLYTDNGIGMVPSFGTLPQGARYALRYGARLIYIPPGQPWRNGSLERWHYTMEREYFRQAFPSSINEALAGLHDWLNYYNHDRPHSSLKFKAPGDLFPWLKRNAAPVWDVPDMERIGPQEGIVEAVRLVNNDGSIVLWQNAEVRISDVFGGQYVRVQFNVTGKPSHGRILYNRLKNEERVIATFNHSLDAEERAHTPSVITNLVGVDFDTGIIPQNQKLDQNQADAQRDSTNKRPVRFRQNDKT